jgi:hypothetical protein
MLSDEASQEMFVDAGFVYNLKDLCQNNGFTPDLYYLHRIDPSKSLPPLNSDPVKQSAS